MTGRLHAISAKIPGRLFIDKGKLILKLIWKGKETRKINQFGKRYRERNHSDNMTHYISIYSTYGVDISISTFEDIYLYQHHVLY